MKEIYVTDIPILALGIMQKIHEMGHEVYLVGGCVRDLLLNRSVNDWDMTTSAKPDEIIDIFKDIKNVQIIPTGIKHGTVTLMYNKIGYEITTYRIDGKYSDGRHPDSIDFASSIEEDLSRRDFTINAMAWNPWNGLVDPFGGQKDLKARRIRCVGNPEDRFFEDALRILRAFRFSCQLNFELHTDTLNAIFAKENLLSNVSKERIHDELCKTIQAPVFNLKYYSYFLPLIIPEFDNAYYCKQNNPWHKYDVFEHTIVAYKSLNTDDVIVRLAVLFHDIAKPRCKTTDINGVDHFYMHPEDGAQMTDEIMRRLKFDNDTRNKVVELVRYHDVRFEPTTKNVKKWLNKLGEEQLRRLMQVRIADHKAQNLELSTPFIEQALKVTDMIEEVKNENQAFRIKDLAINGYDLMEIGISPGKQIGIILNDLLDKVINEELNNEYHILIKYVRTNYKI